MYKVLIVEDEHLIRKWLRYTLDVDELPIIIVGEAENGEEGIELIKTLQPDIVLTDITMPKVDCFSMFEATEEFQYHKVILSGYNDFDNAKKAMKYGVHNFICKPINKEELFECLHGIIDDLSISKHPFSNTEELSLLVRDFAISSENEILNELIHWIHEHYAEKFTAHTIAKELGYSESYLYKLMKEETGITINEYVTNYRVRCAVDILLSQPHQKIYEVAGLVGFSDYKYFNKIFKKTVGMTVTEFRKSIYID